MVRRAGAHHPTATDPAPAAGEAAPGDVERLAVRDVVERFLGDIRRDWARWVPSVDDLWQPPGE
jgi:hypothetical protein